MSDAALFAIAALRAIIEMLGLCLVGQGVLYLMAGAQRASNPVYALFDLISRPPRRLLAFFLPKSASAITVGLLTFVLLFVVWVGLALFRRLAMSEAGLAFSGIIDAFRPLSCLT